MAKNEAVHQADKGILSPDRQTLSFRQRQQYLLLRQQGIEEATARAIAFTTAKGDGAGKVQRLQAKAKLAANGDVVKGKPLGAAYAYARRLGRQNGGGEDKERDRANRYLREQGHAHIGKDDEAELELIKQAMAVEKATYPKTFLASARKILPEDQFRQVRDHARASTGGSAAQGARRAGFDLNYRVLRDKRAILAKQLAEVDAMLAEKAAGPLPAEVHVDTPLDGKPKPKRKRPKVAKAELDAEAGELELIGAALTEPTADTPDLAQLNAARLIRGMDWELRLGAADLEDARSRASRALAQDMRRYDSVLQPDDVVRNLQGIDLDVGSGQARADGYLGLDLYPYDFGTALHDVGMGLPFCDSSLRSVRLVNALSYMTD